MNDVAPETRTPDRAQVRIERDDRVAFIVIDNPPINAASSRVRAALLSALREMGTKPEIDALILIGAGSTFIAGSDLREFSAPLSDPQMPAVIAAIEACPKPVVAAIHGAALGGGYEIALACDGRVAVEGAVVGLPEGTFGIIPGAGGTVRLPRLTNAATALEIITSCRRVKAPEAKALGMIDALVENLRAGAAAFAVSLAGKRRLRELPPLPIASDAFERAAETALSKGGGRPHVVEAVAAVRRALTEFADRALQEERAVFQRLRTSRESAALRHMFFAERAVMRVPGLESVEPPPTRKIGVVGAGTMGCGIAVAFADSGFDVKVTETSEDALSAGRKRIADIYQKQVASGRLTEAARDERLSAIGFDIGLAGLADRDLVIEAVFEDMEVKRALFRELDGILRPGAMLATNTSYLDVGIIAQATSRPADVVGLHFFSPANVMRLVEIVRTDWTSTEVLAAGVAIVRRLRKLSVVCRVCEGFVGNRILVRYRQQAEYLLEEGALPHEVDAAMEAFGFPMGPFAVSDLAGLDIAWARRKRLAPSRDPGERYVDVADRLCEAGRFGRKTGAGWYRYTDGKREPDPVVTELIEDASRRRGLTRRRVSATEIQTRVRAAIVNEACKILDERIAARPLDVDVVMVHGFGYPAWRGGPLFEADQVGLKAILDQLHERAGKDGPGWEPAEGLVSRAGSGGTFYPAPGNSEAA